jgi:hypothetical protein
MASNFYLLGESTKKKFARKFRHAKRMPGVLPEN